MSQQQTRSGFRIEGWKGVAIFVAGALIGAFPAVEVVPNFTGASGTSGPALSEGGTLEGGGIVEGEYTEGAKGAKGDKAAAGAATAGGGAAAAAGPGALPPARAGLECSQDKNGG